MILSLWMPRKAQYIHYLSECVATACRMEADLVSDNVMQDGDIIESRFAVERRNRTIHARMREYLYELKHQRGSGHIYYSAWRWCGSEHKTEEVRRKK